MARRRDLATLLDLHLRLHPEARFDLDTDILWVRRKNPVERLLARLFHRGEARVRLRLDGEGARVVRLLVTQPRATGRTLAEALGVAADAEALGRRDPDLAALLVFLERLRRGGALVTEPI